MGEQREVDRLAEIRERLPTVCALDRSDALWLVDTVALLREQVRIRDGLLDQLHAEVARLRAELANSNAAYRAMCAEAEELRAEREAKRHG